MSYVVGKPSIWSRTRFQELVDGILDSGILTNGGAVVRELESRAGEMLGGHCVAVSSGTAGLELVLWALDLAGRPVTMPSFTYIATAHAARTAGAEIVFCDIEPESLCLDVDTVNSVKPAAILAVNLFGGCGRLERYQSYAESHGIPLIFDPAHAFAVKYRGSPVSEFGLASVFSLHATKLVQGFEGGLVVTTSEKLAGRLRRMRNFGIESQSRAPHSDVVEWGTNAKLSEIHAAMALSGLERVEEALAAHRQNFMHSKARLPGAVRLVEFSAAVTPNYRFVIATVEPAARQHLSDFLERAGCQTRIYFDPTCHRLPPYRHSLLALENHYGGPSAVRYRRACAAEGFDWRSFLYADWNLWLKVSLFGKVAAIADPLCATSIYRRTPQANIDLESLENMEKSVSWRLTEPLRKVRAIIGGG